MLGGIIYRIILFFETLFVPRITIIKRAHAVQCITKRYISTCSSRYKFSILADIEDATNALYSLCINEHGDLCHFIIFRDLFEDYYNININSYIAKKKPESDNFVKGFGIYIKHQIKLMRNGNYQVI
jgi:hypothetical protein